MAEMAEAIENLALVKIGTEQFSVLETPSPECKLVKEYRDELLQVDELAKFVDMVGNVGDLVRVAYYGVAGYTDLQIKIRRIGYDITKLCNKSALTVSKYKRASNSILADLQGTYRFLLNQQEDMAFETLTAVTDVAKDMAGAAEQLAREFNEQSDKIQPAIDDIMKTKGENVKNMMEMPIKREQLKIDKATLEKEVQEREKELEEYEKRYEEARKEQKKAEASAGSSIKQLVNTLFSIARAPFPNMEVAEKCRSEAESHFKDLVEQRDARRKLLRDIAEFAKSIENCTSDGELAEAAIHALHKAIGCLKQLSTLMMKVSQYWTNMNSRCDDFAQSINRMTKFKPRHSPMELWKDISSKKKTIHFYCEWVAIGLTCSIHMDKIKETQKTLYAYLEENPTTEEARRMFSHLQLALEYNPGDPQ